MGTTTRKYHPVQEKFRYFSLPLSGLNDKDYSDVRFLWNGGVLPNRNSLVKALGMHTHDGYVAGKTGIYSSVIFRVPREIYNFLSCHTSSRGTQIDALAGDLLELHAKRYAGRFLDKRDPRYLIQADDRLEKGSAEFLFGDFVFIPQSKDRLILRVEYRFGENGKWNEVQQQTVLNQAVPAGIYAEQHAGLCFGSSGCPNIIGDPALPDTALRVYVTRTPLPNFYQVLLKLNDNNRVGADHAQQCNLDVEPNIELNFPLETGESPGSDCSESIMIRLTRLADATASEDESAGEKMEEGAVPDADYTLRPGKADDQPPMPMPDLTCRRGTRDEGTIHREGFILPRLDDLGIRDGNDYVTDWVLWFDRLGDPLLKKPNQPFLTLCARRDSSFLFKKSVEGNLEEIQLPSEVDGLDMYPAPPDIADQYLGIIRKLDQSCSHVVHAGTPSICGRAEEADFTLNVLNVVNSLGLSNGQRGSNWDRLTTSREHVRLELLAEDGMLKVTQLSNSQPIFILDRDNTFLSQLPALGGSKKPSSAKLSDGQKLIIGSYLLRYVGPGLPDIPLRDEDSEPNSAEASSVATKPAGGAIAGKASNELATAVSNVIVTLQELMITFLENIAGMEKSKIKDVRDLPDFLQDYLISRKVKEKIVQDSGEAAWQNLVEQKERSADNWFHYCRNKEIQYGRPPVINLCHHVKQQVNSSVHRQADYSIKEASRLLNCVEDWLAAFKKWPCTDECRESYQDRINAVKTAVQAAWNASR